MSSTGTLQESGDDVPPGRSRPWAGEVPCSGPTKALPRFPWLVVLLVGLGLCETALHFVFAHRAPRPEEWARVRPVVEAWRQPGDFVAVAPYWAEPVVRWKLGDRSMPVRDVARPDATRYAHAIELSALGQVDPELAGWAIEREQRIGPITVRRRAQPNAPEVTYVFTDHLTPADAEVFVVNGSNRTACPFTSTAQVSSGGLGGNPTFPSSRFACSGRGDSFVGLTVIDDDAERPRYCIWAAPGQGQEVAVRFHDVPLGEELVGHTGVHWPYERDATGSFTVHVLVDDEDKGRVLHQDGVGWAPFRIVLGGATGRTGAVELRLTAPSGPRPACFEADVRNPRGAR